VADGLVLAEVVDAVCVLDVPPLAVGWALIEG